jgi:hypothetical protein
MTRSFGGDGGFHTTSHFHGGFGFHGGFSYHPHYWWGHHGFYNDFGFHFGFGHHYHSHAFLSGNAWYIVPVFHGWFGFNWGGHCSYWPWHHWRHHHSFHHHGFYFQVCRPYWYGFARWYDYSPYSYSYTSLVYDSLYDDGYDDGYDRGYEDGGEDASGYKDDRRRDRIGDKAERTPDELDRAKAGASEEFRHEMNRGTEAFGNGDFKTATKAFKEAAILNPESADARYSLAVSAFAEGKYSFAAFALRRGVALDPAAGNIDLQAAFKDPVVLKGYADTLGAELAENPDDADLLVLSGYVALRTGNASDAAEKLDRALKAAPQDSSARELHRQAMEALEND